MITTELTTKAQSHLKLFSVYEKCIKYFSSIWKGFKKEHKLSVSALMYRTALSGITWRAAYSTTYMRLIWVQSYLHVIKIHVEKD